MSNQRKWALVVAVVSLTFGAQCGFDHESGEDAKVTAPKTETAYIEVQGMIQQLGIT